jgi:hypothetical protein
VRRLDWKLALVGAAAVLGAGVVASAAGAAPRSGGSIVVRLVTDPSPPGVDWSYSGVGQPFRLGTAETSKTLAGLADGTYRLAETGAASGQPPTLTALTCSDPSGGTTVDRATGVASVDLSGAETVTCTFAHRALGPRPATKGLQLAARYAPVLRLSTGERYRPLRAEDYLAKTLLRAGSPPRGTGSTRSTLFSLPATPSPTYLDVSGAEPNSHASRYPGIEQSLEAAHPKPTVYFHLAYQPSRGRVAVEYWFLYLYNDFYDQHEADWEGVTVVLHGSAPLGAAYSQHQGRKWLSWSSLPRTGTHPLVVVARGSHAEYPKPGRYSVRVCWTIRTRRCAPSPRVDRADGAGAVLGPSAYDLQSLGGTGYTGSWGSGNYVLGIGLTKDRITDPRRRAEYSNPFAAVPG